LRGKLDEERAEGGKWRGKGTGVRWKEGGRDRKSVVRGPWTVCHKPENAYHVCLESETLEKLS